MTRCPRCRSADVEFDLAADARIYLSFWTCAACGQRGIARLIDRPARADGAAPAAPHRPPLRTQLPGRTLHRPAREGRTRA
jgi:hypothetical protein